uniref:3-hydroxyisobutyryl-CoA hydrolase-like protein 2, mitochondrial n=1 Tax=Erigeron canadensis TaxID=72917 RepID=UPI001CB91A45|nr:3-hydroxyisobutyryl-CoA hydrolase-like protein 2, mitochondrial [Erigeron canadensis]
MQRLKSLSLVTRSSQKQCHKFFATVSAQRDNYPQHNHSQDEVLVEGRAFSRAAILNRPFKLNAITTSMAGRLQRLYESWEDNSQIGFVTMKGSGRAFCSGADMVAIYRLLQEGKEAECKESFRKLYHFIYLLGTYLKPNLAILDGITMGGGAGIAFPGMFRIATDKTVFATPEVQMGFHPDAGASFYLSRLPGYLGEFLALTGERLNGAELVACGLATHYSLNAKLSWIEERLGQLMTDDPSVISDSLAQYGDLVYVDKNSVLNKIDRIDRYFCHDTVEEIVDALREGESHDELCSTALKKLKEASPLSLKITLQSIREGRFQPLDQCLAREYRTSLHCISKHVSGDFCEGIRARLVDKDYAPKWDTPSLEAVSRDMVDYYFAPLPDSEPELNLPTSLREPFM